MSGAGELPISWGWATLGEFLSRIEAGKSFKCDERPPRGDEIGVVKVSAVTWGRYQEQESKTCTREDLVRPELFVRPGDFLFSRANTIELIGACVIATDVTRNVMLSDKILRFHFSEVEPQWVLWWLRSPGGLAQIRSLSSGNQDSMRNIGQARIERIRLPLGAARERAAVIEAVERQLSRLDAAVSGLQRVQANLKRYRASVLKAAVEGRLVPTEAELARREGRDYEPASVLLERILVERRRRWEEAELAKMKAKGQTPKDDKWKAMYPEPAAPDTNGLPDLPEGWCWATVDQLASDQPRSIQSGPFGSSLLHSEFQNAGKLVIGIDNVQDGFFSLGSQNRISGEKFSELERFAARPGDVLITVMATVGRVCVVPDNIEPAIITKHVYRITCNRSVVEPTYLLLCLWGAPAVRMQMFGEVRGQTRPGLNGTIVKGLAVPLPPLREQPAIVDHVERLLSVLGYQEAQVRRSIEQCGRLRQSILKWAFEGKLVDQDPTEEPASVLLDRIRAERESTPKPAKKSPARKRKPAKKK